MWVLEISMVSFEISRIVMFIKWNLYIELKKDNKFIEFPLKYLDNSHINYFYYFIIEKANMKVTKVEEKYSIV